MQTIESTGKTLDEAIRSGLAALGVEREAVTVEIIQNPKSGFFGLLGSTLARVKLTLSVPEPKPQPKQQQSAHQPQPPRPAPMRHQQPFVQRPAPGPRPEARRAEAPRPQRPPRPSTPASPEHLKKAEDFISGLLKHLDMGVTANAKIEDGAVLIILEGEHIGNLIGRRGDTLDAIQHLVAHVANVNSDEFSVKVHVDAADYRRKRQEALEQLAHRMASNAVKYHSNMTLEPMNAYERHIIHMALQDTPGISTFSTGSEPQRRVVIACQRPAFRSGGRSNDSRGPYRREGDSRGPYRRDDSQGYRGHTPRPTPQVASHDSASPAPAAPPQPRSLPVKEFGVKKPDQESAE